MSSEATDLDFEEDLPFVCDISNKIFKTHVWYAKHMEKGVHKEPAVGMNEFVGKQVQFHVAQCKQITSMHFKRKHVHTHGEGLPPPLQEQGYLIMDCLSSRVGEETETTKRCRLCS